MNQPFSVLMSLYFKEKPEYARECFDSLLQQTIKANEWVIVEDGPLTKGLYEVLDEYESKYPGLIKRVPLSTNQGLGLALREGVLHCSYELIARMDTDDIARKDRFELQLKEFENYPDLDICGSHILEFDININNCSDSRIVPLTQKEIYHFQKTRSAFNHMTVMYKKETVISVGNYEHCPLMEDDMLWVRMMINNSKCLNINEYLVYARTGLEMINRRGGLSYLNKYIKARIKIYRTGFISIYDLLITIIIQIIICLIPSKFRKRIFRTALRKRYD